jgi:hypothetical protein
VQGLVNLATTIADGISVLLPAFCYLAACGSFLFAAWAFRNYAYYPDHRHHFHARPWIPWVSLVLCGVFATFPGFLTMANVTEGSGLVIGLTTYSPTTPPVASNPLGATPGATVVNVVTLFQYFFQAFGAAVVFWAIVTWRAIINARSNGSQTACGVQIIFGVLLINIISVANGIVSLLTTG